MKTKLTITALAISLCVSLYGNWYFYNDAQEWKYSADQNAEMYNELNSQCTGYDK